MLTEITGNKTRTNLTKKHDERTLLTFPDREPRMLSATTKAYTGNPAVKMFIGEVTEIAAEKSIKDIEYASIKAAKSGSQK